MTREDSLGVAVINTILPHRKIFTGSALGHLGGIGALLVRVIMIEEREGSTHLPLIITTTIVTIMVNTPAASTEAPLRDIVYPIRNHHPNLKRVCPVY